MKVSKKDEEYGRPLGLCGGRRVHDLSQEQQVMKAGWGP
jgi:hypothetical protein